MFDAKTCWSVHDGTKAALLVDARDYYRAFHHAACAAKKSILLLGWQFDSDVQLLRGADLPPGVAPKETELLPLLTRLCTENPELQVKILAWNHSVFFTLEREILQKIVFSLMTPANLAFRQDDTVALGGSHHQKVAIIDGRLAFMGSADICQDRWDDSEHAALHPLRLTRKGDPQKPYHEVQAVFSGPIVRSFVDLFVERWRYGVGEELDPQELVLSTPEGEAELPPSTTLEMPRATVALSRTVPVDEGGRARVHEIRDLYVRAIRDARRSIYIETQYLTSCCVRDALVKRLRDRSKGALDVVIVVPNKPEKFKEEITVGHPQTAVIERIRRAADRGGHSLGIYDVVSTDPATGEERFVYVHSKLMIVDDRFFTMGSANLANRSMTLDSELNATWWAGPRGEALAEAIRAVRVRLMTEHLGRDVDPSIVASPVGMVARIESLVARGGCRLRHHDLQAVTPNVFTKAVQELACDYVDPPDARESLPPPSSVESVRSART
ncbi:MAG: phospholipase [Deltaproteobacteria bacterium]|nr:phospholipase [Deltaproteobacteria bacterium]